MIFIAAFIYTAIPVVVWVTSDSSQPADSIGIGIMAAIILIAAAYWTAGILIYRKSRIGLYIWWPCSILLLINFPLGTLVAALAYMYLSKPDAKADLAKTSH